jgi:hypothetical protein
VIATPDRPFGVFRNAAVVCRLPGGRGGAGAGSRRTGLASGVLVKEQIIPVIAEPGQADISQPAPASRVPFYLRDARCEMFAPNDPGPVAMVAMDSPSIAMKRSKVGPPITVKLPVQSLLTE